MKLFKQYIALNENKAPKSSRQGGWLIIPDKQVQTEPNVGGVLADNIILIDFDDMKSGECFLNLVKSLKLKTVAVKTDRGIHFYFKHEKQDKLKSVSHYLNALCLEGDIKVGNKNSYAMIKRNGVFRQTLYGSSEELEEVPFYLTPIKHLQAGEHSPLLGLKEGEGRNSAMSSFKLVLNGKGFNAEQIKTCLSLINQYVLAEPLDERELESVSRDESNNEVFKESFGKYKTTLLTDEERQEKRAEILETAREKKKQKAEEERQWYFDFTKELSDKYHFVQIKGQKKNLLYYYTDNHYELLVNADTLNKIFIDEALEREKLISQTEIDKYILPYLKAVAPCFSQEQTEEDSLYIATNNKLIIYTPERDIKIVDPDPHYFCTVKIPVDYQENTEPCEVDGFLKEVANNDEKTEKLLKELVGYCLFPRNILRKTFFLIGNGGNGKSTFLNLLSKFLGRGNTTNISLYDIENNRFATSNLKDKLANLGDDISSDDFDKLSNFKIITSGDSLSAEFKGAQTFSFNPFCKLIYSCNVAPLLHETTEGIKSRLIYIPFEHKFIRNGRIKQLDFLKKITDKKNLSRLLSIALLSLRNLLDRGMFIEPPQSKKKAEELLREADEVYSFCLDYEAQGKSYDGEKIRDIYNLFAVYLKTYFPRTRLMSINMFSRKLRSHYDGLIATKRKIDGKAYAVFVETKELTPLTDNLTEDDMQDEDKRELTEEEKQERQEKLEEEKKQERQEKLEEEKADRKSKRYTEIIDEVIDEEEEEEKKQKLADNELQKKVSLYLDSEIKRRCTSEVFDDDYDELIADICKYLQCDDNIKTKIRAFAEKFFKDRGAIHSTTIDGEGLWLLPSSELYMKYAERESKVTPPHPRKN